MLPSAEMFLILSEEKGQAQSKTLSYKHRPCVDLIQDIQETFHHIATYELTWVYLIQRSFSLEASSTLQRPPLLQTFL